MELLYVWIKEYGPIHEEGFNFGSKYIFNFNFDKKELSIHQNKDYIDNLFNIYGVANINNVTAIIGENGSGKTCILDFIKYIISTNVEDECVFICKKNSDLYISYPRNSMPEFKFIKNESVKEKINMNDHSISGDIIQTYKASCLNQTDILFYSNIFDSRHENMSNNQINISTNYLVHFYKKHALENKVYDKDVNQLDIYEIEEIEKQLFFLHNQEQIFEDLFDFIPNKIKITPKFDYLFHFEKLFSSLKIDNTDIYNFLLKIKEQYFTLIKNINNSKDEQLKANGSAMYSIRSATYSFSETDEYHLQINIIAHFIFEMFHFSFQEGVIEKLSTIRIKYDSTKDLYKNISKLLNALKKNKDWNSDKKPKLENIIKLCDIINTNPNIRGGYGQSISLIRSSAQEFINYYKNTFSFYGSCKFEWRKISSGERALLTLFSRLHSIRDIVGNDLIILLDEPDLYMHPRWQQSLIKKLLLFFSKYYKESTNIQIILASNNPIVASDIPASNIIFLSKEFKEVPDICSDNEVGETEMRLFTHNKKVDSKETFGANIHSLFADAFFLNNGFIGEFAKETLQDLLKWLNYDKKCFKNKVYKRSDAWYVKNAKKLIDSVGDSVVKRKLNDMYEIKIRRTNDKNKK
jgi:predicted ATP-binding protein involved in virulence